jgi:hypothetical protein
MLAATLQIPATLAVGAEQAMIDYVESTIAACEFDILVLPQCMLRESISCVSTMRYWIELSARKHALVVAGAIEANDRGQFLTTLVAFQGVLWARYVKRYPEPAESHRFKGGRSHCVVSVPGFLSAVVSASELSNIKCTSVFDFPGMAVGLAWSWPRKRYGAGCVTRVHRWSSTNRKQRSFLRSASLESARYRFNNASSRISG